MSASSVSPATASSEDIDASALPTYASGAREPLWWGVLLMVAIEGTGMGLLLVSYFYLRGNYQVWPPSFAGRPALRLAWVQVVLLCASYLPMMLSVRASRREQLGPTRFWLAVATALAAAMLVVRCFEIPRIAVRWDTNAYGSLFWMIFGVHVTHVLTGVIESGVILTLFYFRTGRVEKKHFGDVEASSLLWYFSVLEWLPAFALLYLEPLARAA